MIAAAGAVRYCAMAPEKAPYMLSALPRAATTAQTSQRRNGVLQAAQFLAM